VLVDAEQNGGMRHLLVQADRNGFFYILDRASGRFVHAAPFVQKLNWAKGIDASGRPMLTGRIPTAQGTYICPGITGATNWYSPSYNPDTKLFYVMSLESCAEYFAHPQPFVQGQTFYNTDGRCIMHSPPIMFGIRLESCLSCAPNRAVFLRRLV
jgi:alcohol dehydrogenase (cytochrome c)